LIESHRLWKHQLHPELYLTGGRGVTSHKMADP